MSWLSFSEDLREATTTSFLKGTWRLGDWERGEHRSHEYSLRSDPLSGKCSTTPPTISFKVNVTGSLGPTSRLSGRRKEFSLNSLLKGNWVPHTPKVNRYHWSFLNGPIETEYNFPPKSNESLGKGWLEVPRSLTTGQHLQKVFHNRSLTRVQQETSSNLTPFKPNPDLTFTRVEITNVNQPFCPNFLYPLVRQS